MNPALLLVLVVEVSPNPAAHADVAHAIEADGRFQVALLDEPALAAVLADRAQAACVDDACLLELGERQHVDFVVRIEEARVAAEDVVALTALDVNKGKRAARSSAQIADPALYRESVRATTRHVLDSALLTGTSVHAVDDPRAWYWRGGFIGGGMAAVGVGIALEMLPASQVSMSEQSGQGVLAPVIIGSGLVAIGVGVIANPFEG